jgi:hypothetical protein
MQCSLGSFSGSYQFPSHVSALVDLSNDGKVDLIGVDGNTGFLDVYLQ